MSERSQTTIVNRCLWIYALLLVAMTAFSWAVYFAKERDSLFRPLFGSDYRFSDLTDYTGKIAHLADGGAALGSGFPVFNYPAPAAYVYAFFLRGFPHHPVRVFLSLLLAGLLLAAFLLWKAAHLRGAKVSGLTAAIAATVICGSPMAFAADRGNLEGVVALILGAGLVLYIAKRYFGAAVFIGLAASVKPFSGLFFFCSSETTLSRGGGRIRSHGLLDRTGTHRSWSDTDQGLPRSPTRSNPLLQQIHNDGLTAG